MRSEKDHSLVQSPEKQKQMLDFIVTSYFHSPADVEELKCAVIIAKVVPSHVFEKLTEKEERLMDYVIEEVSPA